MKIRYKNLLKAFIRIVLYTVLVVALVTASLYVYGRFEARWLIVESVTIPLENLDPSLEGFMIVQMSDLHMDLNMSKEFIKEAVQVSNQLDPDLVVLTGDYVTGSADWITDLAPILADLKARLGVYAILGNHDLWTDATKIRLALEDVGIPVLINSSVRLGDDNEAIYLAGLDDGWEGTPDLELALRGLTTDIPVIVLIHEPYLAEDIAKDERVSLQLAGHTHGGHIRLFGLGQILAPTRDRKYDQGLFKIEDSLLYVNRGIGGFELRINCRPEITKLTLVRE
jgi:predicted MPP superfamily phosphohydrolase